MKHPKLPTRKDGTIIDTKIIFEAEVNKALTRNSKKNIVVEWKTSRGPNPTKTINFLNLHLIINFLIMF